MDFLKTVQLLHFTGRFFGLASFSYGPSGRPLVSPSDVFPLLIRSFILLIALVHNHITAKEEFGADVFHGDLTAFIFLEALKRFGAINMYAAIGLTIYTFVGRHRYSKIIQEVQAIDSEVRLLYLPPLKVEMSHFIFNQLHSIGIVVKHKRIFRFTAGLVVVDLALIFAMHVVTAFYMGEGKELTTGILINRACWVIYGYVTNVSFIWYSCQCEALLFAIFMRFYGLNDRFG